jgi:NAD(P)-dependent dehydrogenase (short-subunit alcohol dehydrogenase family)
MQASRARRGEPTWLTNKVALITGGARGIGAAIARVMAGQGARVALLDLDGAEAEKTAAGLPQGMGLACDVGVEADVARAVQAVVGRFGGLDVLVNNAGIGRPVGRSGRVDDMSAAEWDEQLAQDLRTTFVTTRAAAHDGLTLESQEHYSLAKTEFVRSVLTRAFAEGHNTRPGTVPRLRSETSNRKETIHPDPGVSRS